MVARAARVDTTDGPVCVKWKDEPPLRFFEMELGDAWFDRPGDWSLCRRMLLAGVRFTMVDDVVAHLFPAATAKSVGPHDDCPAPRTPWPRRKATTSAAPALAYGPP